MRIIFSLAFLIFAAVNQAVAAPDAHEIMTKNYFVSKVSAFNGKAVMTLINSKEQQRQRKITMWSKLKEGNELDSQVMIKFDAPADIKGTGFLQIENTTVNSDDDIWVYLPALSKVRRMVASNKRDSFFGTDFSYGDILPPQVDKYNHQYLRNELVDGTDCYVIESTPKDAKTQSDSGYSRKTVWIDPSNFIERKVDYYDISGNLLKTQNISQLKLLEPAKQRWVAMYRKMANHQTGHQTIYHFDSLELNQQLKDSFFSTRTLEK